MILDDTAIDKLIQPLLDRQEKISLYVIKIIAQRIKQIGTLLPSDLKKLEQLYKYSADIKKINTEIALETGVQVKEIKHIIKTVAYNSYVNVKPFYDYRHKSFIPFDKNLKMKRLVEAIDNVTAKNYVNLSNSKATGFLMRDPKNPQLLKFQSINDTYKTVIDEAVQATQQGVVDYNTAMRKTLSQLSQSGIRRISWDSGYTQRLDTAVKRNIIDGVKKINQEVQTITGKEFGADGIELTAHTNPAADHAPFQGHQFTKEEYENLQSNKSFKDVNGQEFEAVDRIIGEYNCKHLAISIIIGATKPIYSKEQLQKILDNNEKGYTLPNGKHLTGYECLQHQNELALRIRYAKDGQIAAKEAGDKELLQKYQARINKLTKEYNAFYKASGISRNAQKLTVSGYKRVKI